MILLPFSLYILVLKMSPCSSKIFDKCELAKELKFIHGISSQDIATFVCIAEEQSRFNTEVIGDGTYYGIFQISSDYWCDPLARGKSCNVNCNYLLNDDLGDDVECARVISEEHEKIYGDRFHAWPSGDKCQKQRKYLDGCEMEYYVNSIDNRVTSPKVTSIQKKTSGIGKIYERCELARELKYIYNLPDNDIAKWICIAKHESNFNTSAVGRLNADGSEDHGLFQISDLYWCSRDGNNDGKGCGLPCEKLRDNQIDDDVECIQIIHKEHTRLFGDGFQAWTVYPRCKEISNEFIEGCFDFDNDIDLPIRPNPGIIQPKPISKNAPQLKKAEVNEEDLGKVYERCELALELRNKHKIPIEQIATWICIVKHESNFNTSAVGRLNADGSEDHGLFQISDLYWCSRDGNNDGKGCGLPCEKLRDNQIIDDVECILKIYQEHSLLSGDGFNAWTTYPKCKGNLANEYLPDCFKTHIISGIRQPMPPSKTLYNSIYATTSKAPDETTTNTRITNLKINKSTSTRKSTEVKVNKIKEQRNQSSLNGHADMVKFKNMRQKDLRASVFTTKKQTKAPFDIFAFYLSDYTSKATINYKPIQFSNKRSSLIKRNRAEKSKLNSPTILSKFEILTTTTQRSLTTDNSRFEPKFEKSQISITPHSIDYLLKLTTPKTK